MSTGKNKELDTFLSILENSKISASINRGSLLGVYNGEKRVSLDYIDNCLFQETLNIFSKQDIFYFDYSKFDSREFIIYFSLDGDYLREFKKKFLEYIRGDNTRIKTIGIGLGFPICCVNEFYNFFSHIRVGDMKYHIFDFLNRIKNNSSIFSKDLDIFLRDRKIFHTPCSFNCEESLIIANKTNSDIGGEKNMPYTYLLFKTNEYLIFSSKKYIGEGVYYEYNEKGNRKEFLRIKKMLTDLGDEFDIDKEFFNGEAIVFKFE